MIEIKVVRAFGHMLRPSADAVGSEAVVVGHEDGEGFNAVAIEFSNGYTVEIGQDEGGLEEPMVVRLTFNGEPVQGGNMSWSEQFSFRIPQ